MLLRTAARACSRRIARGVVIYFAVCRANASLDSTLTRVLLACSQIVSRFHKRLEHGYPTPFVGRDQVCIFCALDFCSVFLDLRRMQPICWNCAPFPRSSLHAPCVCGVIRAWLNVVGAVDIRAFRSTGCYLSFALNFNCSLLVCCYTVVGESDSRGAEQARDLQQRPLRRLEI